MSGFNQQLQNAAGAFFGSDYLRDFTHASKTFRTNSYANAPKFKFLFHTYFNINSQAWAGAAQQNLGILVKDIKLPSYSFDVQTKNQYNRKRLIQTKIKYDPITVTFHDDNLNSVNKMWYAYYTYYYKDANKPNVMFSGNRGSGRSPDPVSNSTKSTMADYNLHDMYTDDLKGNVDWGYIGETNNPSGPNQQKVPFFQNITVFGFNQHNFTAYTLINPIITSFSHDTYAYSEGSGVMQNQMTIDYETVVYNEGAIDGRKPGDIVTGFGDDANYDRKMSPISVPGSNATILGQGGLVDSVGGFAEALGKNDIFGAVKIAGTAYNTFKNVNLKNTLKQEIQADLVNIAQDVTTAVRNTNFNTPVKGATPKGSAGAPTVAATQQTSGQYAGTQVNGYRGP